MQNIFFIIILLFTANCTSSNGDNSKDMADSAATRIKPEPKDVVEPNIEAFYNNEKEDVGKIEDVLQKTKEIKDINQRVIAITQEFIGTPYVGGTLNVPEEEELYVNTTALDCLTFVETVAALAKASEVENPTVNDFLKNLRSIRYRDGKINGYPSRLHYISEWSINNEKRGNFKEITGEYDLSEKKVKTIDFMTKNSHLYPALNNKEVLEAIKENEKALQDLHYSLIPTGEVENAAKNFLRSGDIVAIETTKDGLDVSHVGIVNIKNGTPYLIHASSKYKKVLNDTLPLKDYLKRQKSPGIRVFRLS